MNKTALATLILLMLFSSQLFSQDHKLTLVKKKNEKKQIVLNTNKPIKIFVNGKKHKLENYSISNNSFITSKDTISFDEIDEVKGFVESKKKWRKFVGWPLTIAGGGLTGAGTALFIAVSGAIESIALPFVAVIMVGPPVVVLMTGLEILQLSRKSYDMNQWQLTVN